MKRRGILGSLHLLAAVFPAVAAPTLLRADGDHTPIGNAVNALPIFDAHVHYKEPAWDAYPVESIIELMDRNGVAMALVSSTPDEGTIRLWEYAPRRIVPELRPYHGAIGSSNWTKALGIEDYLSDRLDTYPHEGIGEFHIHQMDRLDEPLFREVIRMARERDIFLHVHSGALNPEWERIIFAFPDRLMVGSDTWVNGQWDDYDDIISSNRAWLSLLPREIAEMIAFRNAERAFGRDITMDLIGQK